MEKITLQGLLPNVFVREQEKVKQSAGDIWMKDTVFEKGNTYLIEASSGTGKSSLFSFIYGYRTDYQGCIMFDGKKVSGLSISEWSEMRRKSISILWQELRLFPELTARENVEIKNRLTGCQPASQIASWFDRLGLSDRMDCKIGKMSYGQQQRVAMIRSLCQPFDFLLADEPVSHLDDTNSAIMGDIMMEEARKQGAGIIVTSIGKRMELPYQKIMKI